jgi:hypothetical protein
MRFNRGGLEEWGTGPLFHISFNRHLTLYINLLTVSIKKSCHYLLQLEPPSGGPTLKLWPKRRCYHVALWPCGPDVSLLPMWAVGLLCLHVSLYQRLTAALLHCVTVTQVLL